MRTALALARWELRLALRSVRCKAAVALYLGLAAVPPAATFFLADKFAYGQATFLEHLMAVLPFLTIVAVVLVAGYRSDAASWPETWTVLASSPIGNADYLSGRWLAITAILLPLTALPVLVAAGLAAAAGAEWHDPGAWVGSWALRIAPLVPVTAAMWLGAVTILGGELTAFAATFVGVGMVAGIVNLALARLHLLVEVSLTLGAWGNLVAWTRQFRAMTGTSREWIAPGFPASEAPFDVRAEAEWLVPQLLVGTGVAALVLGSAVAWVRRTRRDLVPRTVRPNHPLRTYLEALLRLRERLAPAVGLGRRDRLAMACGLLFFAGAVAANLERQTRFRDLARLRFEAEADDAFAPLAAEVTPRSWSIRGELGRSGEVDLDVRGTLVNEGSETHARLSFVLNEHLEIDELEAVGRRVSAERAWDRLRLDVEPPLAPAETLELRWRLRGTPAEVRFPLWGRGSDTFHTRFERFRQARFSRELSDLSRSRTHRAVSRRGVELRARDLTPVPRYTPWTLAYVDHGTGPVAEVPEEIVRPAVDLEVDLGAPASFFLADACGHSSSARRERPRLAGSCRTPLAGYTVCGGPFQVVENEGIVFAALPPHADLAAQRAESLAAAARISDRAWPGIDGFDGMVVAEWVPLFHDRDNFQWYWGWGEYRLHGKLLLVTEWSLGRGFFVGGENLVADLMTRDLVGRREIEPSQGLFFRKAIEALMLQRMGVSIQKDATLLLDEGGLEMVLKQPLLEAGQYNRTQWLRKLPAVLFDLAGRVGSETLFVAFDEFLSRTPEEPGTVEELFALLERKSAAPLERFYADFIAGGALPRLELAGVVSRAEGDGFRVAGQVENRGTGEVICPVIVKTEVAVVKTMVEIGSGSAARFEVRTVTAPYAVELDPEGTCYRMVTRARPRAEHVDLSDGPR